MTGLIIYYRFPPNTNQYETLTITGYKILWFPSRYPDQISNCTVGNITLTSIRGLKPATEYVFAIAAMAEGTHPINNANLPTDLYGIFINIVLYCIWSSIIVISISC